MTSNSKDLPAPLALPRHARRAFNPAWQRCVSKAWRLPVLIIVVLEIIVRIGWLPSYQMPAPSEIALTLARPRRRRPVETHRASLLRVLLGFAIGASLALVFAAWVGLSREAEA